MLKIWLIRSTFGIYTSCIRDNDIQSSINTEVVVLSQLRILVLGIHIWQKRQVLFELSYEENSL